MLQPSYISRWWTGPGPAGPTIGPSPPCVIHMMNATRPSLFFGTLPFPCITIQTKQMGMRLSRIDVFCTTHTHTCGKEEHVSRTTCFISEKVHYKLSYWYYITTRPHHTGRHWHTAEYVMPTVHIVSIRCLKHTNNKRYFVTSPCTFTRSTKEHHRGPHSTHWGHPAPWSCAKWHHQGDMVGICR